MLRTCFLVCLNFKIGFPKGRFCFWNKLIFSALAYHKKQLLSMYFQSGGDPFSIFLNCYLASPWPTLGHYRGGSLTGPMLITCVIHIRPEGHREPRNEIRSLSPAKCLVEFEPGTFRFGSQCLNPPYFYRYHLHNTNLFLEPWRKIQHISKIVWPTKGKKLTTCHGKGGKVSLNWLFIPFSEKHSQ